GFDMNDELNNRQLPRGGCGLKYNETGCKTWNNGSASARGLWIEILEIKISMRNSDRQLPQGSCGDRNPL
ncbi:hypothetical protein, partial [Enterocloster citroniae]|uniref:hypothetical protein n=1 Tax=Enterocloster citroniae TaxID=358743 RepID=UPI00349EDBE0